MQIDFHYYCIGVLAKTAGFKVDDALTIAYASQYVDDASHSEQIPIRYGSNEFKFDPVLTSYKKLEAIKALSWGAQKRVWIPFHFLPKKTFNPQKADPFSYIVEPGSLFGEKLLEYADKESIRNYQVRLCKIGIALHTYADTWSHSDFSGRIFHGENDVEHIKLYDPAEDTWEEPVLKNILLDILTKLGHAQAGFYPDLGYQEWEFQLKPEVEPKHHDNPDLFLNAAENIHGKLVKAKKGYRTSIVPWKNISHKIDKLLRKTGDLEYRCQNWINEFGDLFKGGSRKYLYDKNEWIDDAFEDIEEVRKLDDASERYLSTMAPLRSKEGFWISDWVNFHHAALSQRHFVLERIP